jgi:hypothetical protein
MRKIIVLISTLLGALFGSAIFAQAYIGLCCAHCGGNMPLNIPGGGVPETHEFRFKLSQMYMQMGPLRDGTDDLDNSDLWALSTALPLPPCPAKCGCS